MNKGRSVFDYYYNKDLDGLAKAFANKSITNVDEHTKYGSTVLFLAATNEDIGFVKLLLENRANPNHVTNFGMTPLRNCAHYENVEVIRLLLEYGANPKEVGPGSGTLFHSCIHSAECIRLLCKTDAIQLLEIESNNLTPLECAIGRGFKESACALLDAGAKYPKQVVGQDLGWWRRVRKHFTTFKQGSRTFLGVLRFRLGKDVISKDMRMMLAQLLWMKRWE